jgi:hypothetical protein
VAEVTGSVPSQEIASLRGRCAIHTHGPSDPSSSTRALWPVWEWSIARREILNMAQRFLPTAKSGAPRERGSRRRSVDAIRESHAQVWRCKGSCSKIILVQLRLCAMPMSRCFLARFNRLRLCAPLAETSSGYAELLGQLIDALAGPYALYSYALELPGISLSSLHCCFLSRKECPSRVCQFKGSP